MTEETTKTKRGPYKKKSAKKVTKLINTLNKTTDTTVATKQTLSEVVTISKQEYQGLKDLVDNLYNSLQRTKAIVGIIVEKI